MLAKFPASSVQPLRLPAVHFTTAATLALVAVGGCPCCCWCGPHDTMALSLKSSSELEAGAASAVSSSSVQQLVHLVESSDGTARSIMVNPKVTQKTSDPMDLVELARQVQTADSFVRANASSKITVIVEQMRFLQEQCRKVLEEAKRDADLHHAACNMVKRPGQVYYLYERPSGQKYFSMLSPQEWGASGPQHRFHGAYRLGHDMAWTPLDSAAEKEQDRMIVDQILSASGHAILRSPTLALSLGTSEGQLSARQPSQQQAHTN